MPQVTDTRLADIQARKDRGETVSSVEEEALQTGNVELLGPADAPVKADESDEEIEEIEDEKPKKNKKK